MVNSGHYPLFTSSASSKAETSLQPKRFLSRIPSIQHVHIIPLQVLLCSRASGYLQRLKFGEEPVVQGQDFSAAQARPSRCLKGEGAWLDEDKMLLHPRRRKTSPTSQVYIGRCLAALQPWTRARTGPSLPYSFSWGW